MTELKTFSKYTFDVFQMLKMSLKCLKMLAAKTFINKQILDYKLTAYEKREGDVSTQKLTNNKW